MSGPAKRASRARVQREREQRLAEIRAQQARQERARRVRLALAGAVAVLLVIGVFVVVKVVSGGSSGSGTPSTAADPAVVSAVTSVPSSTTDAVGAGSANQFPRAVSAPALTADGKPKILYIGAEYCPFCAAQRWSVVQALSRFGTWSGLGETQSATRDVFPETKTFSFHGASFTSDVVAFTGVETETNQPSGNGYTKLDTPTSDDRKTLHDWDQQKYTGGPDGAVPFIALGGKYVLVGSSYDPGILKDMTAAQISAALSDPNSAVAKGVLGGANVLTAAICRLTDQKPANVCTASGVTAAAAKLPAS